MSDAHSSQSPFHDRILDRLRLQFLRAGNWEAELAAAKLPNEVSSLIQDVVQQTKLLRFEKSEIATELIHHFQDGRDRGHSYAQLVRDFGATDVAISLFRSSKLRSRPMSVKAFRGTAIAFGGGLISYLLLQLFFHAAKPVPTVDYAAKLNEAVTSMANEEKAWPLYRKAWQEHNNVENWFFEELWFYEDSADAPEVLWTNHEKHRRLIRPRDAGWDAAVTKLKSISGLLDVYREASKLPYVGAPIQVDKSKLSDEDLAVLYPEMTREKIADDSQSFIEAFGMDYISPVSDEADQLLKNSMINVLLPHVFEFRRAARLLHVDTRYAMQQKDHARAIENVNATIRLGKQVSRNPMMICSRVGARIQNTGMRVTEELVAEHLESLSDKELKQLQQAIESAKFFFALDVDTEKEFALDCLQRIYSDDGNGDGRLTAVGAEVAYVTSQFGPRSEFGPPKWHEQSVARNLISPTKLFTAPSRADMESLTAEVQQELFRNFETAMWEDTDFDADEFMKQKDPLGVLPAVCFNSTHMKQLRENKIARQDAVLLALAMHRFKRKNGQWPTKHDQLTGKWMDRTPIDRFSGNPLSFTVKGDRPVVYSLGGDGDDDGGEVKELSSPAWMDQESDGDWVLWPQAK